MESVAAQLSIFGLANTMSFETDAVDWALGGNVQIAGDTTVVQAYAEPEIPDSSKDKKAEVVLVVLLEGYPRLSISGGLTAAGEAVTFN
jgi:hypothetical protein